MFVLIPVLTYAGISLKIGQPASSSGIMAGEVDNTLDIKTLRKTAYIDM